MDRAEADKLSAQCTTFLHGHGRREPADLLAELSGDMVADEYGDGGIVAELESEVAELLGTEAACFFVSGTMAQQAALRIHADARGHRTVAFHPTCHVAEHEEGAFEHLHGLIGRPVGDRQRLITLADLETLVEPLAALLLELPQREIGGQLPEWDELVTQVDWARERAIPLHLDGARLWQCPPAWGRSLADIAGLFDTIYVSFYKDLGGLAGSCLAGRRSVIDQARVWRRRHGGTLYGLWPLAASARSVLEHRLPRMADYRRHALDIAAAVGGVDRVRVVPDPPHASMMHLLLQGDSEALADRMHTLARDEETWTWRRTWPTDHPDWQVVELTVGDATMGVAASEVARVLEMIVDA
ncbi:MAG TPA: beta-eliminating lyase-related protein [Nitriliruptorales bacterium]